MKDYLRVYLWAVVCALLAATISLAQQQSSSSNTSLGEVARQLKAQKAKEAKPAKVITNDNLTTTDSMAPKAAAEGKTPAEAAPKEAAAAPEVHGEDYYRARLGKLQDQLETHKRELGVLQQKLAQGQMQYYPDPQKALEQQNSREDINKMTAEIDAKKQQIADDEKAIEDLHDQLRREGGDPGWLR